MSPGMENSKAGANKPRLPARKTWAVELNKTRKPLPPKASPPPPPPPVTSTPEKAPSATPSTSSSTSRDPDIPEDSTTTADAVEATKSEQKLTAEPEVIHITASGVTSNKPKPSTSSMVQLGSADPKGAPNGAHLPEKAEKHMPAPDLAATPTFNSIAQQECESGTPSRPPAIYSLRYLIMLVVLISPFAVTYAKSVINHAILDMVDLPQAETAESNATRGYPWETDNSCPVEGADERARLVALFNKNHERSKIKGEKFQWGGSAQGFLKASYSFGHIPFQVFGSRMSEMYGSHRVMSYSALAMAVCCISAPLLARYFLLLAVDLMVLGMLGGFMTPAMVGLFSNWLTPNEKAIAMTFYLTTSRLGAGLSAFIVGQLRKYDVSWRYAFISGGVASLVFGVPFYFLARSRPVDHKSISRRELEYLASKNRLVRESMAELDSHAHAPAPDLNDTPPKSEGIELGRFDAPPANSPPRPLCKSHAQQLESHPAAKSGTPSGPSESQRRRLAGAPWREILTNQAVWAFIITKLCVKLAGDVTYSDTANYFDKVMHLRPDVNGDVVLSNYVIFSGGCLLSGSIARTLSKNRPFNMSKTTLRKIFQSTASFGVAICLYGVAMSSCQMVPTVICLDIMFFMSTLGAGGEIQAPMDMSERYSGTIHALASTVAASSGALAPIMVGLATNKNQGDRDVWVWIWLIAGALSAFGGFVFVLFSDAKIQSFDYIDTTSKERVSKVDLEAPTITTTTTSNSEKQLESAKTTKDKTLEQPEANKTGTYRESRQI